MSIQTPSGQESDVQATFDTFERQDKPHFTIGEVDKSGAETGVDRRVERSIHEFFHVRPTSATEYHVESGSGARYHVDLYDPDEPECSCQDDARYCKHVWRIFLVTQPAFLTERIFGLGTGR